VFCFHSLVADVEVVVDEDVEIDVVLNVDVEAEVDVVEVVEVVDVVDVVVVIVVVVEGGIVVRLGGKTAAAGPVTTTENAPVTLALYVVTTRSNESVEFKVMLKLNCPKSPSSSLSWKRFDDVLVGSKAPV
jgi:hypothetical protein